MSVNKYDSLKMERTDPKVIEIDSKKDQRMERVEPEFTDLSTGFEFPIVKTAKTNAAPIGVGVTTMAVGASIIPFIDITGISASCVIIMLVVLSARNNATIYLKMMAEMLPLLETIHNNITYIVTLARYVVLTIDETMVDKIYSGIVSIYIQLLLNMRKEEYRTFKTSMERAGISDLFLFMEKKISVDEFEKNIASVEKNTEEAIIGGDSAIQSVKRVVEKTVSPVINTISKISEKFSEESVEPSKVIQELIQNRDYEEGTTVSSKVYGFTKGVYRGIKRLNVTLETKYLLTNKLIFINTYLTNILIDVLRQVELLKVDPSSLEKYNNAIRLIAKKEMDIPEISKIVGFFKNKTKGISPPIEQKTAVDLVTKQAVIALNDASKDLKRFNSEFDEKSFTSLTQTSKLIPLQIPPSISTTTPISTAPSTPTIPVLTTPAPIAPVPVPKKKGFWPFWGGKSKKNRKQNRKQTRKH